MITTPAIEVKNLTVGYGSNVLLQNLNFTVNSGEIFVILGGSGCGKSSLLTNLNGLHQPLAGDVLIEAIFGATRGRPARRVLTALGFR